MKVAREVRIGLCRKLVTCDYISFVLSRWEAYFAFEPTFAASVCSWNRGDYRCNAAWREVKILAFDGCRVQNLVENDKSAALRRGKCNPKSLEAFLCYWL